VNARTARGAAVEEAPRRPRGRPPGSVAGHGTATRERIIDAAIELFAAKGFHAASVADIGASADVQPGALYYHIRSKQELLWEILRRYTEQALQGAEAIKTADLDPVDKLRKLIGFHVEIIVEHRREVAIQVRDGGALTGHRAAELQALRYKVQDCWQRVLDDGHQTGRIRSADRAVVNGLLGMVNMIYLWYRPEAGDTVESIADHYCAMVLDGLSSGAGN
jgi:TetR/AcrR family transcriptional regulator, cholesterol catabolism regulator